MMRPFGKGKNEHFNQCFREITYKIKKRIDKIYYRPTLIFLGNASGNTALFF